MLYLVVYDIGGNRARASLARFLERTGMRRIQRSAFIGGIVRARALDIARYSKGLIDLENDVVHIIPLDRREWREALIIGSSRWSAGMGERGVLQA